MRYIDAERLNSVVIIDSPMNKIISTWKNDTTDRFGILI